EQLQGRAAMDVVDGLAGMAACGQSGHKLFMEENAQAIENACGAAVKLAQKRGRDEPITRDVRKYFHIAFGRDPVRDRVRLGHVSAKTLCHFDFFVFGSVESAR